MVSMKTTDGLSSGRGFQTNVLIHWILRTSIASKINYQIENPAYTFNFTLEKHVDQSDSEIKIDSKHIVQISS